MQRPRFIYDLQASPICSCAFQKLYRARIKNDAQPLANFESGLSPRQKPTSRMSLEGIGERKRFLDGLVIFKGAAQDRLAFFSSILSKRTFSPAKELIVQGDEPDEVFFISKGTVRVYRDPATFISASEQGLGLDPATAMTRSQKFAATQLFKMMCVMFHSCCDNFCSPL